MQFNIFKNRNLIQGASNTSFGSIKDGRMRNGRAAVRFLRSLGYNSLKSSNLVWAQQVFGARVHICRPEDSGKIIKNVDGLISNIPGQIIAVITADCVPIFLYDPKNQAVGILHGSRNSLREKIIQNAIKKMVFRFETNPKRVFVGIGPHIRVCHYWLKEQTLKSLLNTKFKRYFLKRNRNIYFDLTKLAIENLINVGIQKKNIEDCQICTFCNYQKYFSARKKEESPKAYREKKPVFANFLGIKK